MGDKLNETYSRWFKQSPTTALVVDDPPRKRG